MPEPDRSRIARRAPYLLVALVMLLAAVGWAPGFLAGAPPNNDRVLHETLAGYVADHFAAQWPADPWFPSIGAGFPVFLHYPHLSHLAGAAVAQVTPFSGRTAYAALSWLLMAALPGLVALSVRRLGGTAWAGAIGAVLFALTASQPRLGIGWEAYTLSGSGMVPQLWGVALLFPAIAWGWTAIHGRVRPVAGVLVAGAIVAHSIIGYVAAVSIALAALVPWSGRALAGRIVRLVVVGGTALGAAAYFVVPFVLGLGEVLRSRWEPAWKYDSIGFGGVARTLAGGGVFDDGGFPVLTVVVVGACLAGTAAAIRGREPLRLWLAACAVVWLALYCGRAGWGSFIDVVPFASGLPMHRFEVGFQAFALLLAALSLDDGRRRIVERAGAKGAVAFGLALAVLLALPLARRVTSMVEDARLASGRQRAVRETPALAETIRFLRERPPGRVFAGWHYDWGREFAVGGSPVYAHLQNAGFDMVALPFIGMSYPVEWQVRLETDRLAPCDLYGIRYWVAPAVVPPRPFLTPVASFGGVVVYEVPTSGYFGLGRVRSGDGVPRLHEAPFEEVFRAGEAWLANIDLEDREYLAMDGDVPPIEGPVRGTIVEETVAPGRYEAVVRVERTADVVLKATYHPHWEVTVDGASVDPVRVYPGFSAVRVAPGEHRVAFRYRTPGWTKALAVVSVLVVATVAAAGWRRRKETA